MRGLAVAAIAALVLVGAAASSVSPKTSSGLFGTVYRGPIRPLCEEGVRCDVPASGVTLVFLRGGHELARAKAGLHGGYRVELAAGQYSVRTARKIAFGGFGPRAVRVPAGGFRKIDFYIDTGIR